MNDLLLPSVTASLHPNNVCNNLQIAVGLMIYLFSHMGL